MIRYKVDIKDDYIDLILLNHTTRFFKDQEIHENLYTTAYPQYFKRLGVVKNLNIHNSKPTFMSDNISEFIDKENQRKLIPKENIENIKLVEIEDLKFTDDVQLNLEED